MTAPEEPPLSTADAVRRAKEALEGEAPVALVLLLAAPGVVGAMEGARMVVDEAGRRGTLGSAALDALGEEAARAALAGGKAGARDVEVDGRTCSLYVEVHLPPPELVIVGAGHIARPLCRVGAMLGFRVVVLDDRPEFATRERFPEAARVERADFTAPFEALSLGPRSHLVLVTRGHKYDYDALRDALRRPVHLPYIGMVGSRRRVRAALEQLVREGVPEEELRRIHAPIGVDIGAETPEEIAVSIAAELVLIRRGGTGVPLRDRERVAERWIGRSPAGPPDEGR